MVIMRDIPPQCQAYPPVRRVRERAGNCGAASWLMTGDVVLLFERDAGSVPPPGVCEGSALPLEQLMGQYFPLKRWRDRRLTLSLRGEQHFPLSL